MRQRRPEFWANVAQLSELIAAMVNVAQLSELIADGGSNSRIGKALPRKNSADIGFSYPLRYQLAEPSDSEL